MWFQWALSLAHIHTCIFTQQLKISRLLARRFVVDENTMLSYPRSRLHLPLVGSSCNDKLDRLQNSDLARARTRFWDVEEEKRLRH